MSTQPEAGIVPQCPETVPFVVGGTFHCVVTVRGQDALVDVTVENTEGDITWQVQ